MGFQILHFTNEESEFTETRSSLRASTRQSWGSKPGLFIPSHVLPAPQPPHQATVSLYHRRAQNCDLRTTEKTYQPA